MNTGSNTAGPLSNTISVTAIIPAAGSGVRMNMGTPKPLLELCGKTIIEWTLDAISESGFVNNIVVLGPGGFLSEFDFLKTKYNNLEVLAGGATRQQSVNIGLNFILNRVKPDDIILIHDAARCLISKEIIARSVEAAKHYGAITVAVPMVDSVKEVDPSLEVIRSIDRAKLWNIQTPQAFKASVILQAHQNADPNATDDASLVENFHKVRVVEGVRDNIKVTTPLDSEIANLLIRRQRKV